MEKIRILKESPVAHDYTAHLKPVIDFLTEQGNTARTQEFKFDDTEVGLLTFSLPISLETLMERFEFPDTMIVGSDRQFGGAVIYDKLNMLLIHQELVTAPANNTSWP